MVDFAAESPPLNVDPDLGEYISRLERRLAEMAQKIHDFETLHVEPNKRSDGMVRHADGTDWNPGWGKGLYFYDEPQAMWQPAFFVADQETDPVFTNSVAFNITLTQVTNWDTAYSWGDHSVEGYLKVEASLEDAGAQQTLISDGVGPAMSLKTISAGNNIVLTEADENIEISSPDGSFQMVGGEGCFGYIDELSEWPDLYLKSFCSTSTVQISEGTDQLYWTVLPGGVPHNSLSGLTSGDPHTQYHNDTRGDARYYTKTLLDAGQLDTRYYTKTLLDAGQLDTRYYTESEVDALTWDASDIVTGTFADARIAQSNVIQHEVAITHQNLSGAGTNTHAQIDTHIAASTAHGITTLVDGGTFTPTVYDAVSGGNQASVTTASGTYHRINDLVFISLRLIDIDTTGLTGTNELYIRNLPVANGNANSQYLQVSCRNITLNHRYLVAELASTTGYIRLAQVQSGGAMDRITVDDLTSGSADIWVTGCFTAT